MRASAPARRRPRSPATSSAALRGREPSTQRRWLPLAIASTLVGILLGVALWSTGVFDSGSSRPSTPSSAGAQAATSRPGSPRSPAKPKPRSALGPHQVFTGQAFSVAYPRGWTVQSAEAAAPWGTDTTIVAPDDPHMMLRVDVTLHPATGSPITAAEPVIASVAGQPGYRVLGLIPGSLDGHPAERWEFRVQESGVLLHKVDVFFTAPSGVGIAVLTSAPADAYPSLAKRFAALRRSIAAH